MQLTRRETLGLLAAGTLSAQTSPLQFAALDHIEFYVSDVEKSRDFFVRLFGNTVLKNASASKRYLKLGSAYMAFERGAIAVNHFSASIRNMDMAKVHAHLEARSIPFRDYPSGRDTAVLDPDGTRTQLSPANGWSILVPPNFTPETVAQPAEPIFRPTGIEHILLNVTDPEASAAFYEKFFGPETLRNNNRIWFQIGASRVGLLKTPDGQRPGVNHYGVQAAAFDYDAVVRRLEAMGARVEPAEVAGAPSFRDPDGSLMQVVGPRV